MRFDLWPFVLVTAVGAGACQRENPGFGQGTDSASGGGSGVTDGSASGVTSTGTTTAGSGTAGGSGGTATSGTGGGTSGTGGSSAGGSTGGVTSSASGSGGPGSSGGDGGSSSGSGGTGSTGGASSSGPGGSSGGVAMCLLPEHEALDLFVSANGADVTKCGSNAVTAWGPAMNLGNGSFIVRDCGSCDVSCGGEEVLFEFAGPSALFPTWIPPCAQVTVDQYKDLGNDKCEATAVVIRNAINNNPPLYIAGMEGLAAPYGITLDVNPTLLGDPMCTCEQPGCCTLEPGAYSLTFVEANKTLAEGESASAVPVSGLPGNWNLTVHRSHAHELCDALPHFDWRLEQAG